MFSVDFTTTLKDVFHDHESYRQRWMDETNVMRPSTFLQNWTIPERFFAEFLANASFGYDEAYHAGYLTSIRKRTSNDDLITHGIFQDTWLTIQNLDKEHKNKLRAAEETQREKEKDAAAKQAEAESKSTSDGKDEVLEQNENDEEDNDASWRNYAQQTLSSVIDLHQNPVIGSELIELVKRTKIMEQKPREGHRTIVINYDEKLTSECSTSPWERKSPGRPAYLELVRSFVEEFGMQVGFLFVYSDHGKAGARQQFQKMIEHAVDEAEKVNMMVYDVWYDEDSWRERCRYKKCTRVEPRETMHVAYVGRSLPVNKRAYYPGSNHGKLWGTLVLDPIAQSLQVEHGTKKMYYGASMRPGGGPPDEERMDAADGSTGDKVTAKTLVPFCWRSYPHRFDRCFVQAFKTTHIFDFTPGSSGLALALLLEGEAGDKGYHGICHTPEHIQLLRGHLLQRILSLMRDETSALYNPIYTNSLIKDKNKDVPPPATAKAKGKSKAKAKAKAKETTSKNDDGEVVTDDGNDNSQDNLSDAESSAPPSEAGGQP